MTREEAMYLLNNLRSVAEGKEDKAIDMAIEALEAMGNTSSTAQHVGSVERPKVCSECFAFRYEHGDWEPDVYCGITREELYDATKVGSQCPLIDETHEFVDLISRQAAIDAVYDAFCYAYCDNCEKEMNEDLCGDCHRKYQNWSASKKIIEKVINNLPSAQPEIIRCKDCKHYETHGHRCKVWNHGVIVMGYCYRAERRTDE